MTKHLILALILCTAIWCQGNNCPSFNGNDLLQSGKNAIMRGKIGGNPQYAYEAPINFMIPASGLEIAVTTSTIGDYNPILDYGYNYYIQAGRKGTSNTIIYKLIMNNDDSWTSIQLSYLVSARSDMAIGNFQVPINQWVPATSNVYNVYHKLAKTLPKATYKVAAFISGFSTTDSQFGLTVNRKFYTTQDNKLSITFYCSANPAVLTITITYIVYPQVHPIMDISYELTPRGESGSYQISGPVNFQPNKRIQYNQWRVENRNLVCTDTSCSNGCVLRQDCPKLNGNPFESKCVFCPPGVVVEYGTCTRRCGANQMYLNRVCVCLRGFARVGRDCILQKQCGTNQIWSDTANKCVCNAKSALIRDQCLICPAGSSPTADGKSCFCNSPSEIFDQKNVSCKSRCFANQQWVDKKCTCVPRHCWWNQQCRKCPDNADPSPDQSTCIPKNPNAYYNPEDNTVYECGKDQVVNKLKSQCICKDGWKRKDKVCVPDVVVVTCKDNQVLNAAKTGCDCKFGWTRAANGVCQPICQANELYDAAKGCSCVAGWGKNSGVCRQCPAGAVVVNNFCICSDANSVFVADKWVCATCQANSAPNPQKNVCVCKPGFITKDSACIADCKDPEVVNAAGNACECKFGWTKNANGVCTSNCLANEVWDGKVCNCVAGWGKNSGVCRQCPAGAVIVNNICVCSDVTQYFAIDKWACQACFLNSLPTPDKTGCVCKLGFVPKDGACVPDCKDPEVLNVLTGVCDCKAAYVKAASGKCEPRCAAGEAWDGNNCLCPEGQARYGSCKKCPAGSVPNSLRTACICADSNQILQISSFTCVACPANSHPKADLSDCVCNDGLVKQGTNCVLKCGANQVPNYTTAKCDCIFGFHKPANVCVARCGAGEQYNGVSCVCKPGYGLWNKVCTDCPADSIANAARTNCKCVSKTAIFNPTTFKCQNCPDYATSNDDGTKCLCNNGYQQNGNFCSPICDVNEELDAKTNTCDCKYGFLRLGPMCVERCGLNNQWTGKQCRCRQNHIKHTGACRPCPEGTQTNPARTTCLCKSNKHIFDYDKFVCAECPQFSAPNVDGSDFVCFPGYKKQGKQCVNTCPEGASPDGLGHCVCGGGLYLEGNVCKKPVACPSKSTWNAATLECVCDTKGQFIINGQCQACGEYAVWNAKEKKCTCSTGFFLIGNVCTVCDPRTRYNGTDCVCNLGYFGNRDKCQKCHGTCAVCSGPEANQCQSCSDVSLILQNSFCTKNSPCSPGFWLDQTGDKVCKKCTDNCIICDDIFQCQQCAIGYEVQTFEIGNQKVDACVEICGDGIRYEAECDDGNTKDGDGCSSTCFKQPGWECVGGSSAQKSSCNKYIPDQSILTSKGTVNLGDRVVQSIRASYLPTCLTQNECSKCFKSLKVNVVDANVPILVTVNYIPFSQYQFLIEYNFQGLYVTSRFKTVIRFSEEFRGCLTDDDFDQQLEVSIDPAFLAKYDLVQELSFGEINGGNKINVPPAAKGALGIKG